jgi:bifunctional lysine-specific demethylase and histidyl-hydroxylase NO66
MGVAAFSARGLAWLMDPVEPTEFFDSYWEKRPLEVQRADPAYYSALPGLSEVDGLITTMVFGGGARTQDGRLVRTGHDGKLSERPFRLEADGRPDIHDIYCSYGEGYTVVLNGIHWRSAVVGALCRDLEADFQHRVGVNLYLTPRSAQGLRPHVDSHDVVILQMHGVKEWRVGAAPSRSFPTAALPSEPIDSVPDAQGYLLTPGDALYIPRGYAHEAVTQTSSSLHLTVGIHVLTWADLLGEALHLVAAENPDLRRALPVGHLGSAFDKTQVAAIVHSVAAVTSESILEAARLSLGSRLLQRQAATAGHFHSLDSVPDLMVDSVVARGFQGPCRLRVTGERVVADYPGNYLSVPPFLVPALEHAVNTGTFTVGSIPGDLSDSAKIEFAARLVSEGFLSVVSNRKDRNP